MGLFVIKKEGTIYRLFGQYEKVSNNGTPMILLQLKIHGQGTKDIMIVRYTAFNKAVKILKENEIKTHEDFYNLIKARIN